MTSRTPPLQLDAAPFYATGMVAKHPGACEDVWACPLPEMLEREPGRLARHYHSSFQVMLLSGNAMIEIGGRESRVTSHSLALIYPACVHRLTPLHSFSGTSISFSPSYFEQLLGEMGKCGRRLRQRCNSPVLELDPLATRQMSETVAAIQFELDRLLVQRDLMIRECLKLLLMRASRLQEKMV